MGEVPLGAGCLREPHRGHDEAQPRARDARHDDPARAGAGRLRLLRRPPRFRGRAPSTSAATSSTISPWRARPTRCATARSSRSSASTRSRAPTSTAPSTRWRWSGGDHPGARESARLSGFPPTSGRPTSATARGATPVLHPMFIVSRKPAYVARAPWRKTRETAPERAPGRRAPPRTQRRHTRAQSGGVHDESASTSAARSPT